MSYFIDSEKIEAFEISSGISLRTAWGKNVMMSVVTISPGSVMEPHFHSNEQAGIVLKGEFLFTIGKETKMIQEGDMYIIPSNVEHNLCATNEEAVALDIFSPPRTDYQR
jgi:quercetin dioxygenase-like cupin family protein